jgi:hypothetical protein
MGSAHVAGSRWTKGLLHLGPPLSLWWTEATQGLVCGVHHALGARTVGMERRGGSSAVGAHGEAPARPGGVLWSP